jgi:hypothetical protein
VRDNPFFHWKQSLLAGSIRMNEKKIIVPPARLLASGLHQAGGWTSASWSKSNAGSRYMDGAAINFCTSGRLGCRMAIKQTATWQKRSVHLPNGSHPISTV